MPSSTRAGGCFLTLFILLGFLYGLSIRNPLKGVLIGLAIGAVLAIATWLIDRGRLLPKSERLIVDFQQRVQTALG